MKLIFWNKVKESYNKYKFSRKYSQLFISFLYIVALFIEVIFRILGTILAGLFHELKQLNRERIIHEEAERKRRLELKSIYEEGRAYGYGVTIGRNRAYESESRRRIDREQAEKNFNRIYGYEPKVYKKNKWF